MYSGPALEQSPYGSLLSANQWQETADMFLRDACALLGLSMESPLAVAVNAGCVALPSLLNITGDPGDGIDIWTENIVINAQEASWISESGWSMRDEVLNCVYLQRECCKLAVSWVVSSLGL